MTEQTHEFGITQMPPPRRQRRTHQARPYPPRDDAYVRIVRRHLEAMYASGMKEVFLCGPDSTGFSDALERAIKLPGAPIPMFVVATE